MRLRVKAQKGLAAHKRAGGNLPLFILDRKGSLMGDDRIIIWQGTDYLEAVKEMIRLTEGMDKWNPTVMAWAEIFVIENRFTMNIFRAIVDGLNTYIPRPTQKEQKERRKEMHEKIKCRFADLFD